MSIGNIHNPTLSLSLRGNGVEEVPKGFVSWYKMQEKIHSKVFLEIDMLLSQNDPYEAIEIFEISTKYNRSKVWH